MSEEKDYNSLSTSYATLLLLIPRQMQVARFEEKLITLIRLYEWSKFTILTKINDFKSSNFDNCITSITCFFQSLVDCMIYDYYEPTPQTIREELEYVTGTLKLHYLRDIFHSDSFCPFSAPLFWKTLYSTDSYTFENKLHTGEWTDWTSLKSFHHSDQSSKSGPRLDFLLLQGTTETSAK